MGKKIMLEVTQPVVNGNEVVVHAGELFKPGSKLPEGVTVREVIVDADDKPAAGEPEAAGLKPGVAEADQPRGGSAKAASK
jgi:hypothetical protein